MITNFHTLLGMVSRPASTIDHQAYTQSSPRGGFCFKRIALPA